MRDRAFFEAFQARGVHILPVGFYFPVPDTRELRDVDFGVASELAGIDVDIDAMRRLLDPSVFEPLAHDFWSIVDKWKSNGVPVSFGGIDGLMLNYFVRTLKPNRIVEVGGGFSTVISAEACIANAHCEASSVAEVFSIDPSPREYLKNPNIKNITIHQERVQKVPLEVFESLDANDILFIDSSHVAKCGSDVVFEINEILPRLRSGVYVHFHDINLPFDYKKDWIMRGTYWNEQYMLQAFLQFNEAYRVLWGSTLARAYCPDAVKQVFPEFDPAREVGGSFWMKRL